MKKIPRRRESVHPLLLTARWKRLREKIYLRDHGICARCGLLTIPKHPYHNYNADHIIPINHKTATEKEVFDEDNLQLLCSFCHIKKTQEEVATKQKQLYYVDPESGDILKEPPPTTKEHYRKNKLEYITKLREQGKISI